MNSVEHSTSHDRIPRRAGFTMPEMLMALALLGILANLAILILRNDFAAVQHSQQTNDRASSMDSALTVLRSDVWTCDEIIVIDSHTVQLRTSGKTAPRWQIGSDESLARTDAAAAERWPGVAGKWSFSVDGPSLVISTNSSRGPEQLRLVSQILLAAGRPK